MKFLSAYALSLVVASALAKLQITLPNSHTEWEAGAAEMIRWKPIDGGMHGRVSIELMEGADALNMESVTTIAENIPATNQQLAWTVPKNLKNSNNYAIKIVDEDGEEYYGRFFKGQGGKTDIGKKSDKKTKNSGNSSDSDDSAPVKGQKADLGSSSSSDKDKDSTPKKVVRKPVKALKGTAGKASAKDIDADSDKLNGSGPTNGAPSWSSGSTLATAAWLIAAVSYVNLQN
ncbi:hypothetical protein FBU59_003220 [Linderina macrospora]|uniref:Uncharacterized protein n=1 Tax=Linderina macrospora TaxID=4868 RepID=A0ACC1J938_9FUNG|nr:hypothetical protein FBU59_003220 [Linderina macrospora]